MTPSGNELSDVSMLDLFRMELETQTRILEEGLVGLEKDQRPEKIEPLMRAAHSIKGAARIVGLDVAVDLAHAIEDVLSATQTGRHILTSDQIDILLRANDVFLRLKEEEAGRITACLEREKGAIEKSALAVRSILDVAAEELQVPAESKEERWRAPEAKAEPKPELEREGGDYVVRVTAENLSRLMGLAGESLIEARSLGAFYYSLVELKDHHGELSGSLEELRLAFERGASGDAARESLNQMREVTRQMQEALAAHMEKFDLFCRRLENLADRLYNEVIATRMRPFSDGTHGFARMVRGLAKELGKKVNFQIEGETTKVDRDILERLEAPLTHLLRNAVDHGVETPEERLKQGKSAEGKITLEARHRAGMLSITVSDDGRGIDLEEIKSRIVEKDLGSKEMADNLSRSELMEFLFLPGFTTAKSVSEISGRGVGLDVVRSMIQEVGGSIHADTSSGKGSRFHLQLPLSLSVVRTLLVEIAKEPYAIPLTRIDRILSLERAELLVVEDRQFYSFDGSNVGLINARQILQLPAVPENESKVSVVVISDRMNRFGLVVDRFLGERELVVKPLESSLGKVPNISAAAILEDGSPVLIMDVDDVVRSIDNVIAGGRLQKVGVPGKDAGKSKKRVLVVDDSLTVREVERRLLENNGYEVEVAVDGMDGWNAVRRKRFDLVISDIDMPRMNGIDFVKRIKNEPRLRDIPVMIVSYKDRDEDRIKGLEAGANYYLTKSSFHDESLINAVEDLIGKA